MNVRLPDQASTLTDAVAPGPVAAPSLATTVHAQVSPSEVADAGIVSPVNVVVVGLEYAVPSTVHVAV